MICTFANFSFIALKEYLLFHSAYDIIFKRTVNGMNASLPPDDFEKGKGLSHGVDEVVSVPRLKRGMKIYARALLKLSSRNL